LVATLSELVDPMQAFDDSFIRLRGDLTPQEWRDGVKDAAERLCLPHVDEKALAGLKFNSALPHRLAEATLAARLADLTGASAVLAEPARFGVGSAAS
jgi:ATP-dependent Lhr-like helicase